MKEGDDADAMYFIVVGALEVLINKGTLRVTMLRRNQYFGESGLLKTKSGHPPKRNATIRTVYDGCCSVIARNILVIFR